MGIESITQYKSAVDSFLVSLLIVRKKITINTYETDLLKRLIPYVTGGKTIRGSLAVFSYTMFGKPEIEYILPVAAAIELFHSGFLIHDDIMDGDELRRGRSSIHSQYAQISARPNTLYGTSMGINAGDYCFFLGYQLISQEPHRTSSITHMFSREFTNVVSAQMADVSGSSLRSPYTEEYILDIYRYKTARYTFALPLCVGATLAGAPSDVLTALDAIGEDLGLAFQIRDDELNLVGDSKVTGKSTDSDRRSRTQTLISFHLHNEFPAVDLASLSSGEIKKLYAHSATARSIDTTQKTLKAIIFHTLDIMEIPQARKETLRALAHFVQTREN